MECGSELYYYEETTTISFGEKQKDIVITAIVPSSLHHTKEKEKTYGKTKEEKYE